ncbi:DUF2442 domain-containing protein [uncultured Phascolarctobacterium sp.]|uniref:DUF2442 domain-containing protein n=1 Tax=uncultured Phascolarctobacterium sp. TaxID=512296 RepID=UPI0025F29161|nr:DUF2442 domain-containing protein [uncultured Phascolarctobacterium sp.]
MKQDLDFKYFYPIVQQVVPAAEYRLYLYFNDGSVRLADISNLIVPETVFEPLMNKDIFNKVTIIGGAPAWDLVGNRDPYECIDLDPLELFKNSPVVADPLADKVEQQQIA